MLDYIASRHDQFIEDLETIVNIDSGSLYSAGVRKIVAYFQERFSNLDWYTQALAFADGDVPCLEAANVDPQAPGTEFDFLFLGHMDTVFLEGTVQLRPFSIDGNHAKGPGVCDMKGGLVAILHVMETLQHFGITDNLSLCAGFNSDEEIGSNASRAWLEALAAKSKRVFIFEPCRIGGQRVLQRKGAGWYNVICRGKAAHAGVEPEKGANAVVELAHHIVDVAGFGNSELGTTVNVNIVNGGTKSNVIPDFAKARVDVRFAETSEVERIEDCFQQITQRPHVNDVRTEVDGEVNRPPMVPSEKTRRLWDQIAKIGTRLGQEMELIATGGGSDGNFTSAMGIPTIDGMGPRGGRAHSEDEFLDLKSITPTVQLVSEVCKAAAEGKLD
jgi:glutamate carboxypeptidase